MSEDPQKFSRTVVSGIMIAGTWCAMLILAASVLMMTFRGVHPDLHDFGSMNHAAPSPRSILQGILELDPVSIAMLGVVLILLIPVARTLGAALIFAKEKDVLFTAMSVAIVLALIAGTWSHLA